MGRRAIVVATVAGLLLAAATAPVVAGGGGGGGACAGFTDGREVVLRDFCLDGTAHFLPEGRDLTVVNGGEQPHDYVAVDGSFRTGLLQPGDSATVAQPAAGVHRVRCTLHASEDGQGMAGVLVVGDRAGAALAAAGTGDTGVTRAFPSLAGWLTAAVAGLALALSLAAFAVARRPREV